MCKGPKISKSWASEGFEVLEAEQQIGCHSLVSGILYNLGLERQGTVTEPSSG